MDNSSSPVPAERRYGWRLALVLLPLVVLAGLAVLFASSLTRTDREVLPSPLIGKPVAEFALPGLAQAQALGTREGGLSSGDLSAGQPYLVNFWASWCAPCRVEHPLLMQLARANGIKIAGINYRDAPAGAQRFLRELGNPYDLLGVDEKGRIALEFGLTGVPETFVIAGDGTVLYRHVGPVDPTVIREQLLPRLRSAYEQSRP